MEDTERITVTYFEVCNDFHIVANLGIHIKKIDLYIGKMKLIQKKDGSFYVCSPSESYHDPKTGQKKYSNLWWWGEKIARTFQTECLKAINKYCFNNNVKNPMYK